jgi:hypothetical protein
MTYTAFACPSLFCDSGIIDFDNAELAIGTQGECDDCGMTVSLGKDAEGWFIEKAQE